MNRRRNRSFGAVLAGTLMLCAGTWLTVPARADVTESDVVGAVTKAKVLQPGYAVSATVSGDQIVVNTYRNPSNSEADSKIDAILIAKAVFDSAGSQAAKVTVRFYAHDLSSFDEVAISAGDVKAFASGQTTKDQLLSSLTLEQKRLPNALDKMALQMQGGGSISNNVNVHVDNQSHTVEAVTTAGSAVSDDRLKLDALIMAMNAKSTFPEGTQHFKVTFMDPSYRAPTRQFVFNSDDIDAMWKAVQDPLHALQPTRIDASLDFIKLAAGAYPDERAQLLHRLKDLQKSQIPIQAYVNAFFQIEDSVHRGDDASTLAQIKRLNASIDDQEKQLAARNRPVTHTAAPTQQVMSAALTPEMIKEEKGIRFVGGQPVIASEVLKDPEVTARKFEMLFQQRPHDLACAYLKIAGVLRTGNRASEAVAFESKASQLWNRR